MRLMFRLDCLLQVLFQAKGDTPKFIFGTGRTFRILQYDKELALKGLVTDTAKQLGGMT